MPSLKSEIRQRYLTDAAFHAKACVAGTVLLTAIEARGYSLAMEDAVEIACAQLWQAEQLETQGMCEHRFGPWLPDPVGVVRECGACKATDYRPEG